MYLVRTHSAPETFYKAYEIDLVIDSAMIFAVVVELAWNVLRPIRSSLPKYTWLALAILIALAGLPFGRLPDSPSPTNSMRAGSSCFGFEQTMAILRVVVFLVLAGCSHLLSIGWRNRELQIASGLGFFSIVSLAVGIMHTHLLVEAPQFHLLDQVVPPATLRPWATGSTALPPKKRSAAVLRRRWRASCLAAAGTARSTRINMNDSRSRKDTIAIAKNSVRRCRPIRSTTYGSETPK